MKNMIDQSQNEIPSQNMSKHFEQSEFYQKFIMGHNILNESEFSGNKDYREYTTPSPHLPEIQQNDITGIRNKVVDQNRKLKESKGENLRLEKALQDNDLRIQAFKQQIQNLIKEVDRLQHRPEDINIVQDKQYRDDMQALRNRILQETNSKTRSIEQMEEISVVNQQLQITIEEQKHKIDVKTDELKQSERICEQFKTELLSIKKKYIIQEENLAESKASAQGFRDENQEMKLETVRQKDQAKHLQNDHLRLRKEIDNLKILNERNETKLLESKQTIQQLQYQIDNEGKQDSFIKLKQQLEQANQDINKYRALQAQGILYTNEINEKKLTIPSINNYNQNSPPKNKTNQDNSRISDQMYKDQQKDQILRDQQRTYNNDLNLQQMDKQRLIVEDDQLPTLKNQLSYSPQLKQKHDHLSTLIIGDNHMQNFDQICDLEQELMNLQLRKNEVLNKIIIQIEGNLQRMETTKIKSQGQITRKKHLEQEFDQTTNQIQSIRKNLRNYNAMR